MKGRMTMNHKRSRGLATLAILATVAVCVAACGSSSSSSSSSSSTAAASAGGTRTRAKLAACLKQHGVTLPSRPAGGRPPAGGGSGYGPPPGGGAGFFGGGGRGRAGGRAGNPKFRAAFQACGATAGFRGRAGGGRFRPTQAAITKFASCVKQHGYTLPKANLTGKGAVYPASIERNAKFESAARACQSALRPAGGAPPGGAAPGA
jgi:hypothetical protein